MKIKSRKKLFVVILVLIILLRLQKCSPDAVSNHTTNQVMHLVVVANRPYILDKDEFATEVFRMYENNTFKTIRFAKSIESYKTIEVSVYLWKWQFEKTEPSFKIRYSLANDGCNYYEIFK